jgi:hypothetical protein
MQTYQACLKDDWAYQVVFLNMKIQKNIKITQANGTAISSCNKQPKIKE